MRKILVFLLIAMLSVACVGCGNNNSSNTDTPPSTSNDISNTTNQNNQSNSEHKVGDVVNVKNEELTVTDVQRNYKTGNEYTKAETGNEFVKVTVKIKNNSDDKISVSPLEFKVLDSNGVYHDYNYLVLKEPLKSVDLAKGGSISGSVAFEVPKNDTNLKLVYTPSLWSDEQVEIKL